MSVIAPLISPFTDDSMEPSNEEGGLEVSRNVRPTMDMLSYDSQYLVSNRHWA